jgi:hypothetical protein
MISYRIWHLFDDVIEGAHRTRLTLQVTFSRVLLSDIAQKLQVPFKAFRYTQVPCA